MDAEHACCAKAVACQWCARNKHHVCTGCHGCGCLRSAQAAQNTHGFPMAGKKKP